MAGLGGDQSVREGGAWRAYSSSEVFGAKGARSLIGIFGSSSRPDKDAKDPEEVEVEEKEQSARKFGALTWSSDILPPDFIVISDAVGPSYRADFSVYIQRDKQDMKEVRFLGPRRASIEEARKDGCELKRVAFTTAQRDQTLSAVWKKSRELAEMGWAQSQLAGDDVAETSEQQLPAVIAQSKDKKIKHTDVGEWYKAHNKEKDYEENFRPLGASWTKTVKQTQVPKLGGIWYMHERQTQAGKHYPMLFFNAVTGKYYRNRITGVEYSGENSQWVQTGPTRQVEEVPIKMLPGSACFPSSSGRKDDLAVMLPGLANTASMLKYPIPFVDRPSSLFLLVDGLRDSNAAAMWCAKNFHSHLLPRLSACHSDPEDFELVAMVKEALETLDLSLLESNARYSGCSLAMALLLGSRLVVCSVGACRAYLCSAQQEAGKKSATGGAVAKQQSPKWSGRLITGNISGHTIGDVRLAGGRRRADAFAALDYDELSGGKLSAASVKNETLTAESLSERDIAIRKAVRAAHPFATLGLTIEEARAAAPGAGQSAVQRFNTAVGTPGTDLVVQAAWKRVQAAGQIVDQMLTADAVTAQQLAEVWFAMDDDDGLISSQRAQSLLGVVSLLQANLGTLTAVCPAAMQGWDLVREVIDAANRQPAVWIPAEGSRAVEMSRAMGLRDLKRPRNLVGIEMVSEVIHLDRDNTSCLVLLTDGVKDISEEQIVEAISRNNMRPKAVALDLATMAAEGHGNSTEKAQAAEIPSVGALTAFFSPLEQPESKSTEADPKKRKVAPGEARSAANADALKGGLLDRVRVAHILLKLESMPTQDLMARRPPPKARVQTDAEKELLKMLQVLNAIPPGAPGSEASRKLSAKFAELAKEHSDCKSATSGALADLGWVHPGQMDLEFETVAFELPIGGLSDIIVTWRGLHIIHRLG